MTDRQTQPLATSMTRRQRKKDQTRRAIYDAATRLFGEHGFEAVTIEQICDAADVAKTTFFLHFPTKGALIFESAQVVTRSAERLLAEPSGDPREDLRRVAHHLFAAWGSRRQVMEPMLLELLRSDTTALGSRPENRALVSLLASVIGRGQASGVFRASVMPKLAAVSFLATGLVVVASTAKRAKPVDLALVADSLVDLMMHGLLAEPEVER
jgi:AcrR family transcriptional regulator